MNLELTEKAVLVTGGASGIGAASVRAFVAEGARVAIVDRNEDGGEGLAAELSSADARVVFIKAELADEIACREAVARAHRAFGRLDILVNNAGGNDAVGLEQSPAEFL